LLCLPASLICGVCVEQFTKSLRGILPQKNTTFLGPLWLKIKDPSLLSFARTDTPLHIDNLSKTKITGDKNIDAVQDGVNEGVGGQLGKGGLLEGVGNLGSKEAFTRSERGGKGESGGAL
jgi:hypothetical protein